MGLEMPHARHCPCEPVSILPADAKFLLQQRGNLGWRRQRREDRGSSMAWQCASSLMVALASSLVVVLAHLESLWDTHFLRYLDAEPDVSGPSFRDKVPWAPPWSRHSSSTPRQAQRHGQCRCLCMTCFYCRLTALPTLSSAIITYTLPKTRRGACRTQSGIPRPPASAPPCPHGVQLCPRSSFPGHLRGSD